MPIVKKKTPKQKTETEIQDFITDQQTKKVRTEKIQTDPKHYSSAALRGVMDETLARCYGEIFPGMSTHDEVGNVDIQIREESYIVCLTMVVGNDNYTPRKGLKIRESEISSSAKLCKAHR